jgi:hypothetical protein
MPGSVGATMQRANFIKRMMHKSCRQSVGERENEKTSHFGARCDSGCCGYDCRMHIILKSEPRSGYEYRYQHLEPEFRLHPELRLQPVNAHDSKSGECDVEKL